MINSAGNSNWLIADNAALAQTGAANGPVSGVLNTNQVLMETTQSMQQFWAGAGAFTPLAQSGASAEIGPLNIPELKNLPLPMRFMIITGKNCGSKSHWDYGSGPGSKSNWDYGSGAGSKSHWDYGSGMGSKSHWDYGSGPGSKSFWDYGSGPGSKSHWDYGSGPGSKSFWDYGSGPGN